MLSQRLRRDRCADPAEGLEAQAAGSVETSRLVREWQPCSRPPRRNGRRGRSNAAGTIATGASMCFRLYNQMPPHDAAALLEQRDP